jgi:acyl carrier protein
MEAQKTSVSTIQNWLVNKLADQLSLDTNTIDITEPLTRYGLDSIDAVTMVGDLEDWLDLELPSTLFWDYPTIAKSAEYLVSEFDVSVDSEASETPAKTAEKAEPEPAVAGKGWGGLWGKISGK